MGLRAVIAKLDDVAENLRGFYVKGDDGRFYLDAEGVDDMPAVRGLKSALEKERTEFKGFKQKFDGIDPEGVTALKAELEELKSKKPSNKTEEKIAELENRIAQMTKLHAEEKSTFETTLAKAQAEKDDYIITSELRGAMGMPDIKANPMFIEHILKPMTRLINGKAVIVDEAGNPRIKTGMGEPVTPRDVLLEMKGKPEYAGAFPPSGANGSGAAPSGGGTAPGVIDRSKPGWAIQAGEVISKGQDPKFNNS